MSEEMRETPGAARWLAWATAVLLVLGVVSAGILDVRDGDFDADVVSAAGGTARTVEAPSSSTSTTTVTSLPPVTSAPVPGVARSTTVPKAAAAVLAAIGSTPPPTAQPSPAVTPTTSAPVTPTPATTTTSIPATTSTTAPGRAAVTLANEHPNAFLLNVNGRVFKLEPGEEVGPVDLALLPTDNDVLEANAVADPTCVRTEAADFFQPGGRYRLAIVAAEGACGTIANLQFEVTPA